MGNKNTEKQKRRRRNKKLREKHGLVLIGRNRPKNTFERDPDYEYAEIEQGIDELCECGDR